NYLRRRLSDSNFMTRQTSVSGQAPPKTRQASQAGPMPR
uniref:Synapsin I (Fragments) n=1 Tax=Bos taurus TaxID=9913 RepID=Q7M2L4_BOVIN